MKRSVISLLLATVPIASWSGEAATPVIDGLVSCAKTQDTRQRLACFDRLAEPFRPREAASVTIAPAPAPVSTVATGSFGEERLKGDAKPAVPAEDLKMHARITGLRAQPPDAYIVTLDNGQSWRHENQHQAQFLREGDAITVTRTGLGTYRLMRDAGESKNWIRVTRVR